mmetsp:Transcript_22212/g.38402  ORF Transcript_22212/g.38402 Transcript_22212/m.38402 type:complete len:200 (-) Transcript_22212:796-1395(-)
MRVLARTRKASPSAMESYTWLHNNLMIEERMSAGKRAFVFRLVMEAVFIIAMPPSWEASLSRRIISSTWIMPVRPVAYLRNRWTKMILRILRKTSRRGSAMVDGRHCLRCVLQSPKARIRRFRWIGTRFRSFEWKRRFRASPCKLFLMQIPNAERMLPMITLASPAQIPQPIRPMWRVILASVQTSGTTWLALIRKVMS